MLIGVNVGPNLTYVGSLATLLWRRVLHAHDHDTDLGEFVRLGALTVPPILSPRRSLLWLALRGRLMRVVVWITEAGWEACVDDRRRARCPPTPTITLLAVPSRRARGGGRGRAGRAARPPSAAAARPELDEVADDAAARAARRRARAPRPPRPRREVRHGRVEREVVAACEGADLLVLARDGDDERLGPKSLGQHARFVVDHAPCRVLLVWPGEPPAAGPPAASAARARRASAAPAASARAPVGAARRRLSASGSPGAGAMRGGRRRCRHRPALAHDAIDHAPTTDRTERCSSVSLHLGLLEDERAWQLLSLQRGPDVY